MPQNFINYRSMQIIKRFFSSLSRLVMWEWSVSSRAFEQFGHFDVKKFPNSPLI